VLVTAGEARVGVRVKAWRAFVSVPLGTEGVIDEDYGTGVTVAWDLPDAPLPAGYCQHLVGGPTAFAAGRWAHRIVRDGFDKELELGWLAVVENA
jgi:hypothetical protein